SSPQGLRVVNPEVVVPNGGTATLVATIDDPYENIEWRYNGIPLFDREGLIEGTKSNQLKLNNIRTDLSADPYLALNNQVGLYEIIVRHGGCTNVGRFEVEISSVQSTKAPHSVDQFEE